MADKNRRILIVDDNRAIHNDFRKILGRRNEDVDFDEMEAALFGATESSTSNELYELDSAYQGQEAVAKVQELAARGEHYALAFVDIRMPPGWDGVETIERLWQIDPDVQIVICTAYSDYSWEQILERFGASDRLLILKKPFDTAEVCQLALALTEKWHLARHAHLKLSQLNCMVLEQTRELRVYTDRLQDEIVQRRELEQSLRTSESRYALAAAATNDGLWDWDLKQNVVFYSPRWKSMLGYGEDEVGTTPGDWFDRILPEDRGAVQAALDQHLAGQSAQLKVEYRIRHRDGQLRWMACRGMAVREGELPSRIAGSQSDITDRHLAEQQLRHEALHDALTGLANRSLFAERARQSLLHFKRDRQFTFAVLFLDLDRFKSVNDNLGHQIGDRVLVDVAQRLVGCVRGSDAVAQVMPGDIARLGGDEFVLLLDGLRSEADAFRVAERLIEAIARPFTVNGHEIFVGASIGIAFAGADYEDAAALMRDADIALYQAKSNGKGRYEVFNREMHSIALNRWSIENDLRQAIERGELHLVYQPIVCARTGSTDEFEALLRWNHPKRGAISPAEFIPVAEETGLILPIGAWVLRAACEQLVQWDRELGHQSLSISVNVSGKQLAQSSFIEVITDVLKQTGADPRRLRLEITETALLERGPATNRLMTQLRELDLRLHLDDFGTGYSSLSYLHQMPVAALKIDRSFVSAMMSDSMSASIVQAIVALGHAVGMQVIAEGVETLEQLRYLQRLKCDRAQGYYFSKPLAIADVVPFLSRQHVAAAS